MYALIDPSGECVVIVDTLERQDVSGMTVVAAPEPVAAFVWDKASQSFIPRPPTDGERTRADLSADPRWTALKTASGAEIDTWLANNVTTLAQARQVLGLLLRAVRILAADGRLN